MEEIRNAYRVLVGRPHNMVSWKTERMMDKINMDLKETGCNSGRCMEWLGAVSSSRL
jgi:hypothetical protein